MRRIHRTRSALYFAIALAPIAVAWLLAVVTMSAERERTFAEGAEQARRLAVFFEQHALGIIRYGDAYVKAVRLEYARHRNLESVREYMDAVPLDHTLVSHITIIDASGTPILVSGHEIKPGTTAKDRDYFRFHRDGAGDRAFISLPHMGRNSGKLVVRLVRRFDAPDGSFGGVIFAALDVVTITEFFKAMSLGPNSSATLVGMDKRIRARSSYGQLGPGQDISGSRIWRELELAPVGLYEQISVVDGITRQYAYRALSEYPLIVAIGVAAEDMALAISTNQTPAYAIAGLVTVLVLTMTLLLWREVRNNRQLESSEAHVRTVVETVLDGIITIDETGRIESYNNNAQSMFGYERGEIVGRNVSVLAGDPDRAQHDGYLKRYLETGEGRIIGQGYRQVTARRKDGSTFPAELAIGEIHHERGRTFVGTIRDITARVEAEVTISRMRDHLEERIEERTAELEAVQAELLGKQRLAVLGQLTGTVAHELRNPLSAIANSTAVLERRIRSVDPRVNETFARLQRNVVRCNSIITELLDFTRARGLEPQPTRLDEWLGQVLDEMALPESVGLRRTLAAPGVVVEFDRERVRRAIVNLLDNARDAVLGVGCPGDQTGIEISSRASADRVEIEVADRGVGIPAELMAKIHEPLFSTKSFGVGLGLPVVRRVMEEHGGEFHVDSEPGGGTRALLVLPCAVLKGEAMA